MRKTRDQECKQWKLDIKRRKSSETLREDAPKEHDGCCFATGACIPSFYPPSGGGTNLPLSTLYTFGFKGIGKEAALQAK